MSIASTKTKINKMSKIKISTKTGDKGQSSLADGTRLPKDSLVFSVLGELDELNSYLGLIVAVVKEMNKGEVVASDQLENWKKIKDSLSFLFIIQADIYSMSSELANYPKNRITDEQLKTLEKESKSFEDTLETQWVTKFLFPGGSILGAHLDIARTICRRAELKVVRLFNEQPWKQAEETNILKYINRLSDYLYLLRTFCNAKLNVEEKIFEQKH